MMDSRVIGSLTVCGEDHVIGSKPDECFACLAEQRDKLLAALKIAQPEFCSMKCPSVFFVPASARHLPACIEMRATLDEVDAALASSSRLDRTYVSAANTELRVRLSEAERACKTFREAVQALTEERARLREALEALGKKWLNENGDYPESKSDCSEELAAALASSSRLDRTKDQETDRG